MVTFISEEEVLLDAEEDVRRAARKYLDRYTIPQATDSNEDAEEAAVVLSERVGAVMHFADSKS